jgi:hypothetical protein
MSWLVHWWVHRITGTARPSRTLGVLLTAALLVAVFGAAGQRPASSPEWSARPTTAGPPAPLPAPERAAPVPKGLSPQPSPPRWSADPAGDFVGWALLVSSDDARWLAMSDNGDQLSTTASMIKVWIAADYLRRVAEAGGRPGPTRLAELTKVIRDSDNRYADEVFLEIGAHESIERLIEICGLPFARAVPDRWSNTQLSPVDAALMGSCIEDGRAAGPEWTGWLLAEMRQVRGLGDFGIRDALPPEDRPAVAIKNGWVIREEQDAWHVNCLAIGDGWTMGVMTRYPADLGYEHGAEICRSVAVEHLPEPVERAGPDPDTGRPDLQAS